MGGHQAPKVLLAELQERTSAAGNRYLSGFLGKARIIGFWSDGEDRDGNAISVVRLFVQEPEQRQDGGNGSAGFRQQRPQERDASASPELHRQVRANKAAFDAQVRHEDAMTNLNDPIPN